MKRKVLTAISAMATFFALIATSAASTWIFYQPKAPKSLSK